LTYIIGLLILALLIVIFNGLLRLGNLIIRGPERVIAAALVIDPETIRKYVPDAITRKSNGEISLDIKAIVAKLFGRQVGEKRLMKWAKSGNMQSLFVSAHEIGSRENAAAIAVYALRKSTLPDKVWRKAKVYSIPSAGTDQTLTAYLVAVGNIPKPPPQLEMEYDPDVSVTTSST
jgi:hypothetical protein